MRIDKDITLSAWIYVGENQNNNDWHRRVLNVYGNPNHHYEIYVNTGDWNGRNDQFRVGFRAGGTGDETGIDCINNDCSNRPVKGKWYMISYTFAEERSINDFDGDGVIKKLFIRHNLLEWSAYTYLNELHESSSLEKDGIMQFLKMELYNLGGESFERNFR